MRLLSVDDEREGERDVLVKRFDSLQFARSLSGHNLHSLREDLLRLPSQVSDDSSAGPGR